VSTVVRLEGDRADRPVINLGVIAHDRKKDDLLGLVRSHRSLLEGLRLVATRTTGRVLQQDLDVDVELVASGTDGGDIQIGASVVDGRIDAHLPS
jgi:methylglyoxal synthase